MSSSGKPHAKHALIGVLSALGGAVLGVSGMVLFNRFKTKRVGTRSTHSASNTSNNVNDVDSSDEPDVDSQTENETSAAAQAQVGVYIQDQDGNRVFLTNEEFQEYFELHVGENNSGVELDACFLDYALKINPMNLRFFADSQKTPVYERMAVDGNISSIQYCKNRPYRDEVNELSYQKYDIEEYAYAKYGDEIFEYIDDSHKTERDMIRNLKKQIQQDLKNYSNKKPDNDTTVITPEEVNEVEVVETGNEANNDVANVEVLTASRVEVPVFEPVDADLDSDESSSLSTSTNSSVSDDAPIEDH